MHLLQLLQDRRDVIIESAERSLRRAHLHHYEQEGDEQVHHRLRALYALTLRSVAERNLGPMLAHAELIAQERFKAGYDLYEVQSAFNALEEAIWKRFLKELEPTEMAEGLGLISTVIGAGKDALACSFVSLAGNRPVTSMNLQSLFGGTAGG